MKRHSSLLRKVVQITIINTICLMCFGQQPCQYSITDIYSYFPEDFVNDLVANCTNTEVLSLYNNKKAEWDKAYSADSGARSYSDFIWSDDFSNLISKLPDGNKYKTNYNLAVRYRKKIRSAFDAFGENPSMKGESALLDLFEEFHNFDCYDIRKFDQLDYIQEEMLNYFVNPMLMGLTSITRIYENEQDILKIQKIISSVGVKLWENRNIQFPSVNIGENYLSIPLQKYYIMNDILRYQYDEKALTDKNSQFEQLVKILSDPKFKKLLTDFKVVEDEYNNYFESASAIVEGEFKISFYSNKRMLMNTKIDKSSLDMIINYIKLYSRIIDNNIKWCKKYGVGPKWRKHMANEMYNFSHDYPNLAKTAIPRIIAKISNL